MDSWIKASREAAAHEALPLHEEGGAVRYSHNGKAGG